MLTVPEVAMVKGVIDIHTSNPPARETEFIPHSHPELEIGFFKSGRGIYTLKDCSYDIYPGDIFLFNTDELHKVTTIFADEPMSTIAIHFQPRLVWDALTDADAPDCLDIFRVRNKNYSHKIDRTFPDYEKIASLILDAQKEWDQKSPLYLKMIKNMIIEILVRIVRSSGITAKTAAYPPNISEVLHIINACVDYIDNNFCEDISIHDLAAKYGMSQNFFTLCFKKVNGITPKSYVCSKRIDKAIKLIRDTDMTMLEIATRCGFNSSASFNKTFTKTTGKKPLDYRKAYEKL